MILHPRALSRRISLIPLYYGLAALALALAVHRLSQINTPLSNLVSQPIAVTVLATIASGMIAFTGVVFSLVLLAVQFGSSQYSPRLTRYLVQDPVIRNGLGTFSATFLYALFALVELVQLQITSSALPLVMLSGFTTSISAAAMHQRSISAGSHRTGALFLH